jgi:hypothetical protein
MEADLRGTSKVNGVEPAGRVVETEEKKSGWELHQRGLELEGRQDLATEKRRKNWSQFLHKHTVDEDAGLLHDAERLHIRSPLNVPVNVQQTVAQNQTRETRDAIEGSGRRSIPKRSIGRGALVGRTEGNQHVEAQAGASKSDGQALKLGVRDATVHRPQGFGARNGTFVFT